MTIHYVDGDATDPRGGGPKVIAHVCNDAGGWGAGFVLAVSRRWPQPEEAYRAWHAGRSTPARDQELVAPRAFGLGSIQIVRIDDQLLVANMVAQRGYPSRDGGPAIRYTALAACLQRLDAALVPHASVHMPRIGCSLAGGRWEFVEIIIREALRGREVYVYDLPGSTYNL